MAQKAKEKNTTAKKSGKSRVDNTVKSERTARKKSLEKDSPIDEQHTDQVEETGSVLTTHKDSVIHCLTIIGQIEDITFFRNRIKRPSMSMLFRCLYLLKRTKE